MADFSTFRTVVGDPANRRAAVIEPSNQEPVNHSTPRTSGLDVSDARTLAYPVIPYVRSTLHGTALYRRGSWIAAIFLALFAVLAEAADTFRLVPLVRDEMVLVSFDLADGFTEEVRAAIKSGLQTTITYTVDLRAKAPLWLDRTMASAVVSTTVQYDNLTRRHTVVRTLDGRVGETRVTEDEAVVKALMTNFDRVALFRTTLLEPNREYYVRVHAQVRPSSGGMLWPWSSGRSTQTKFTFIP
jgi:hypothetical protein